MLKATLRASFVAGTLMLLSAAADAQSQSQGIIGVPLAGAGVTNGTAIPGANTGVAGVNGAPLLPRTGQGLPAGPGGSPNGAKPSHMDAKGIQRTD